MGEVSQGGLVGRGEGLTPSRGQFLPANEPFDQDEAALIGRLQNDVFGLERAVPVLIDVGQIGQAAANELLRQALAGPNANVIVIAGGVLDVIGGGDNADEPIEAAGVKRLVVEPDAELVFPAGMAAGIDVQGTVLDIENYGKITQAAPVLLRMGVAPAVNYSGDGVHELTELANAICEIAGAAAPAVNINFGGTITVEGLDGSVGAVQLTGVQQGSTARAAINNFVVDSVIVDAAVTVPVLITANLALFNDVVSPAPLNISVYDLVRARIQTSAAPSATNVIEADRFGNIVIDSEAGPTAWSLGSRTPGDPMSIGFLGVTGGSGVSMSSPCNADRWQAVGGGGSSIATAAGGAGQNSVVGRAEVGAGNTITATNGADDAMMVRTAETGGTFAGGPSGLATTVLGAGAVIAEFDPPRYPIS